MTRYFLTKNILMTTLNGSYSVFLGDLHMKIQLKTLKILCLFSLITILGPFAFAKKNLGVGIILGSPTGLSANYYTSSSTSIDVALSFSLGQKMILHINKLWLYNRGLNLDGFVADWFWGVGGRLKNINDNSNNPETQMGPRVVIGLNKFITKIPIQLFGELALTMNIIPETTASFDFGIGARYYF